MDELYPCSKVCAGAFEETVRALILTAENVDTASLTAKRVTLTYRGPPFPHEVHNDHNFHNRRH